MTSLTPYLCAADARAALAFYGRAFGAVTTVEPWINDDGRVGHSEFEIDGVRFMMSEPYPELQAVAPSSVGASVTFGMDVADCDASVARAREAGATIDRGPDDQPHGRAATLRDPFGHRWMLISPLDGHHSPA